MSIDVQRITVDEATVRTAQIEIQPTLHGEAPADVCGRADGTVCGAPATAHVIWRYSEGGHVENSLCCATHETEARRTWAYLGLHPYSPACADPRWVWVDEIDRCVVPEDCSCTLPRTAGR